MGLSTIVIEMTRWQRGQFPVATGESTMKHLRKELAELEKDPENPEEWVDIFFLAIQGLDRTTNLPLELIRQKLHENKHKRQWPGPDSEGVYEHDRSQEP